MFTRRPPSWLFALMLPALFLSLPAHASEKDELASTLRLLDQTQASLERARVAAAQADPADRGRYFFDYRQATSDINAMKTGIGQYLEPSRAQPATPSIAGHYSRERP